MHRRALLRLLPVVLMAGGLVPLLARGPSRAEAQDSVRFLAVADTGSGDANQRAVGVEHEEFNRAATEVVVTTLHAERFVSHLGDTVGRADVVVPEHRVKGHSRPQQLRIGALEGALHHGEVA